MRRNKTTINIELGMEGLINFELGMGFSLLTLIGGLLIFRLKILALSSSAQSTSRSIELRQECRGQPGKPEAVVFVLFRVFVSCDFVDHSWLC